MQRRTFLMGLGATLAATWQASAQGPRPPATNALSIRWFGHMAFGFVGQGVRLLTHPFRPAGCTERLAAPMMPADLVLIGSRLLDEGYLERLPSDLRVLSQPGAYTVNGLDFQGIRTAHDRLEGRRFGMNVVWRWQQAGLRVVHLGGTAAALRPEERILIGQPDVLLVPVGGGDKGYTPQEAKAAADAINPKIIIPTHFRTAKSSDRCELGSRSEFTALFPETAIRRVNGTTLELRAQELPATPQVISFGLP
ncbi:MAG: MBL fold metallo-hydrolase [Oscillatoriales cyanobacterium SM2_1_8]|nr:MBL fold metallo-hydrolase [Oscillatoriales cyanobacterium SM2_1_8]